MADEPLLQVQPGNIFLHDVMQPVAVAHFVDLHDVGMDQRRGRLGLALEALQIGMVVGQFGLEDLDGHAAFQAALLGQVDLGHGPASQAPQQDEIAQLPAGKVGGRGVLRCLAAGVAHECIIVGIGD